LDAIIGRYKVRMEESGLVLQHPTGISFDLQPDEVLVLWKFINFYRESLTDSQHKTDPQLKAINTEELFDHNKRWRERALQDNS